MIELSIAIGFVVAWLAVGLGLFIAFEAAHAIRSRLAEASRGKGRPAVDWRRLAAQLANVALLTAGLVLVVLGGLGVGRVVPW